MGWADAYPLGPRRTSHMTPQAQPNPPPPPDTAILIDPSGAQRPLGSSGFVLSGTNRAPKQPIAVDQRPLRRLSRAGTVGRRRAGAGKGGKKDPGKGTCGLGADPKGEKHGGTGPPHR